MSYDLVKDVPQWQSAPSGGEMNFNVQSGLRIYGIIHGETGADILTTVDGTPKSQKMIGDVSAVAEFEVTNTLKIQVTLPGGGGGQWKIVIVALEVSPECSRLSMLYDNSEGTVSLTGTGCSTRPETCTLLLAESESTKVDVRLEAQESLMAAYVEPGSQQPVVKSGSTISLRTLAPGTVLAVLPNSESQRELSYSIQYSTGSSQCYLQGGFEDPTWTAGTCQATGDIKYACAQFAPTYDLLQDVPQWHSAQSGEEIIFTVPQSGLRVYGVVTGEAGGSIVSTIDNGQPKTDVMGAVAAGVVETSVQRTYKIQVNLPGGGQWKIVITAVSVPSSCSSLALLYENCEGSYSLTTAPCATSMCALLLSPSESTKISMHLESPVQSMQVVVQKPGTSLAPTPEFGTTIDVPNVQPGSMLAVMPMATQEKTLSFSLKYTTDDATCYLGGGAVDDTWRISNCNVNSQLQVSCQSSGTKGDGKEGGKKPPLGAIIGGVVGAVVVIAIVAGVVVFFVMKSNKPSVPENTPETV